MLACAESHSRLNSVLLTNVPTPYCFATIGCEQFVVSKLKAIYEITRTSYPLRDLKHSLRIWAFSTDVDKGKLILVKFLSHGSRDEVIRNASILNRSIHFLVCLFTGRPAKPKPVITTSLIKYFDFSY